MILLLLWAPRSPPCRCTGSEFPSSSSNIWRRDAALPRPVPHAAGSCGEESSPPSYPAKLGQDGEGMIGPAGPLTSLRAASRCFHSLSSMACSWSSRSSCLLSCSAKRCIFSLWERGGGNGKEGARGEVAGVQEAPRGGQFCSGPRYLHLLQLCQALSLLLLQLLQLLRLLLLLLLRLRSLPPLLLLRELRWGTARVTLPFPKSHRLQLFGDFVLGNLVGPRPHWPPCTCLALSLCLAPLASWIFRLSLKRARRVLASQRWLFSS